MYRRFNVRKYPLLSSSFSWVVQRYLRFQRASPQGGALTTKVAKNKLVPCVAPPSDQSLHVAEWVRMDPVAKWTTLKEIGRQCEPIARVILKPSLFDELYDQNPHEKRLLELQPFVAALQSAAPASSAVAQKLGMQIVVDSLRWIVTLQYFQDAFARLRIPFPSDIGDKIVTTTPTQLSSSSSLAFRVFRLFPVKCDLLMMDLQTSVDMWIPVARKEISNKSIFAQFPIPSLWDPVNSVTIDDSRYSEETLVFDEAMEEAVEGLSPEQRLQKLKGEAPRLSAEDERQHTLLLTGATGETLVLPAKSKLLALGTSSRKQRQLIASDLRQRSHMKVHGAKDIFPSTQEEGANSMRDEGSPLTTIGTYASPCVVRVGLAQKPSPQELKFSVGTACASILSALYIQGRVVQFHTNSRALHAVCSCIFRPIAGRFFSSLLEEESSSESSLPRLSGNDLPVFRCHLWLMLPTSATTRNDLVKIAQEMLAETASLRDELQFQLVITASQATIRDLQGVLSKDVCRNAVHFVPLCENDDDEAVSMRRFKELFAVVHSPEVVQTGSPHMRVLQETETLSVFSPSVKWSDVRQGFDDVNFLRQMIHGTTRCGETLRDELLTVLRETKIRLVGVNRFSLSPMIDSVLSFPEVPLAPKSIGNCYRLVHGFPQESPEESANGYHSVTVISGSYQSLLHPKHTTLLELERAVDFLMDGKLRSAIPMLSSKFFL